MTIQSDRDSGNSASRIVHINMGVPSIIQVYRRLADLAVPHFENAMEDIAEKTVLDTIDFEKDHVKGNKFTVIRPSAFGVCTIYHPCMTDSKNGTRTQFRIYEDKDRGDPPVENVISAWLRDFAQAHFGRDKGVPTYNLKLESILDGKNTGEEQRSFAFWFREEKESITALAKKILRARHRELRDEFAQRLEGMGEHKKAKLIEWAMEDIQGVLVRYQDVPDEEIKTAILMSRVNMVLDF